MARRPGGTPGGLVTFHAVHIPSAGLPGAPCGDRLDRGPGRPYRPTYEGEKKERKRREPTVKRVPPYESRAAVRWRSLRRAENRKGQRRVAEIVDGATEAGETNQRNQIKPGKTTLLH